MEVEVKTNYKLSTENLIEFEIFNSRKGIAANFALTMAIIAFVLPVLLTVILLLPSEDGLQFGLLLSFFMFWGTGIYLLRLALWNKYGKEVFVIEKNKFRHYNDYKYFKDNSKEIEYKKLEVLFIETSEDEPQFFIVFEIDSDKEVISHNPIPYSAIEKVAVAISEL